MREYLDDILIFLGCGLILYATYQLSLIAAMYLGGILLIMSGLAEGISGKKGNKS